MGVRIHLMASRDICCEETSPFKYLKFFSQNAEPLHISAQKWCLFDFLQYLPLHPFQRQMRVDVHLMACRDFYCEETSPFKYLKFFSQNAEPLRPLPFQPKSGVYLIFYNICHYTPFQRQMGVRIHLMACRDICCEETSPFKYLKFFSQNAEPFRPKSGVYLIFYNIYLPLHPFQRQMRVYSMSISWHVETFIVRKLSPFKYLKFFSQNAETTPALAISAQKWCLFDLSWPPSNQIK